MSEKEQNGQAVLIAAIETAGLQLVGGEYIAPTDDVMKRLLDHCPEAWRAAEEATFAAIRNWLMRTSQKLEVPTNVIDMPQSEPSEASAAAAATVPQRGKPKARLGRTLLPQTDGAAAPAVAPAPATAPATTVPRRPATPRFTQGYGDRRPPAASQATAQPPVSPQPPARRTGSGTGGRPPVPPPPPPRSRTEGIGLPELEALVVRVVARYTAQLATRQDITALRADLAALREEVAALREERTVERSQTYVPAPTLEEDATPTGKVHTENAILIATAEDGTDTLPPPSLWERLMGEWLELPRIEKWMAVGVVTLATIIAGGFALLLTR